MFGGIRRRGIYDNIKTAIDKVGRDKDRDVNVRFQAMASHYLFEPEFCNPASGWEKGQVEKNVQVMTQPDSKGPPTPLRKDRPLRMFVVPALKIAGCTVAGVAVALGLYLGYLQVTPNFATVVDKQVYRSAQLDDAELRDYVASHGIKSIINLRGENIGTPWYDTELAVSRELGIEHLNFAMSASRELNSRRPN